MKKWVKRILKGLGVVVLLLGLAVAFVSYTAFGHNSAIAEGEI
jgi:hypothetical protein